MRKVLQYIVVVAVIFCGAFSLYKISSKYSINILKNNIECTIVAKGCEKAKAVTSDDDKNIYVAYSDYIKIINKEGKEKIILKNRDIDIEDLVYYEGNLIYIYGNNLNKFSLSDSSEENLCSNIPTSGNDIKRSLFIKDNLLFIAIGSKTNSGIAEGEEEDLSPINITLNGVNYGGELTGAFKKKGIRSDEGEKIKGVSIGNAAIYTLNLKNKKLDLYASGIRGIKGIGNNSKGEIITIFSGIENEGLRPVNRDKDYIYKVEKGIWYGWPDFSGGDPISSPKFKGENLVKSLIKNSHLKSVPEPIYESESINELKGLAVDNEGKVLEKDTIIFWDRSKEKICTISAQSIYKEILKLKSSSNIESIVYSNDEFLILDNGIGCVYSIHKKGDILGFRVPVVILFFIFMLIVSLLIILLYKLCVKRKS